MPTQEFRIVLDGDSSGLVQALKQAGVQVDVVEGKAAKSKRTLESMSSTFLKVGSVWTGAVIAGAGYMAKVASETEQLNLSFEVLLKSGDAAKKMMKDLQQFANVTPFGLTEIASATKALLAFGVAAKDVPRYLKTAGDAASGMEVPFEQAARVLGRVKQGMVSMDEIIQIGLTKDDMTKWGAKFSKAGEAISDKAVLAEAALKALEERFGGMMEKKAESLAGRISTLGDAFKLLITDPQGRGMGDAIARELKGPVEELSKTFDDWKASGVTEDMGKAMADMVSAGAKGLTGLVEAVGTLAKRWDDASESTKSFVEFTVKALIVGGPLLMAIGGAAKSVLTIKAAWDAVKVAAGLAATAQTAAGVAGTTAAAGGLAAFTKMLAPIAGFMGMGAYLGWRAAGGTGEGSLGYEWAKRDAEYNNEQARKRAEGFRADAKAGAAGVRPQTPIVWGWDGKAAPAPSPTGQTWVTLKGGSGPLTSFTVPKNERGSDARPLIDQVRAVEGQCQANIGNLVEAVTGYRPTQGGSANEASGNALASGAARVYRGQALNVGDKLYLSGGKYGHTVLYIGNGEVLDSSPGGTPIGNGWYLRPVSAYKGRIKAVEATGFRLGASGGGGGGQADWTRAGYTSKMMAEAGLAGMSGDLNAQQSWLGNALKGVQGDLGDLRKLGVSPQSEASLALRRQELDIQKQIKDIEAQRLALLANSASVMQGGMQSLFKTGGGVPSAAPFGSGIYAPAISAGYTAGLPQLGLAWSSAYAGIPRAQWSLPAWATGTTAPDPFGFYAGGEPTLGMGAIRGMLAMSPQALAGPTGGLAGGGGGTSTFSKLSQGWGALSSLMPGLGGSGIGGAIGSGIQAWGLGESLIGGSLGGPVGLLLGGLGGLFEGIFGGGGPSIKEQLDKIERNTRPLGKVFDVRWASTPSSLMPAGLAYAGASRGAF